MSDGSSEVARTNGFAAYAVATLVPIGVVAAFAGEPRGTSLGMFAAWVVQLLAFRPLLSALDAKRDATRAWLGGLALRAAGLMATGGLAVAGVAGSSLPVAYGTTMMVLLLVEAGWLFRRLPRARALTGSGVGTDNGIERTTTG